MQSKPALLNKREEDKRFTMQEVIQDYPTVRAQKQIRLRQMRYHQQMEESSQRVVDPDPKSHFVKDLGDALLESQNKSEFIEIFKRNLMKAAAKDTENPI
jgi:hypothetical protein